MHVYVVCFPRLNMLVGNTENRNMLQKAFCTTVRRDYRGDSKALIIKVEGFALSLCPAVTFMRELPFASLLAGRGQQFVWFHPCMKGGQARNFRTILAVLGNACPQQS